MRERPDTPERGNRIVLAFLPALHAAIDRRLSPPSALMLTLTAIVFGAVLAFNRLRGAVAW